MHNEFRYLKYGLVPIDLDDKTLDRNEQILISYLRTAASFQLLLDTESSLEVFEIAKSYIGKNFANWLTANYRGGHGARALLCKTLLLWEKSKVSDRAILDSVVRDLNHIDFLKKTETGLNNVIGYDTTFPSSTLDFSKVKDELFFNFIAFLGPEMTAKFLLSLNGIKFVK